MLTLPKKYARIQRRDGGFGAIWTLWDMIQAYADLLVLLRTVQMCQWIADTNGIDGAASVDAERRNNLRDTLSGSVLGYCRQFEITTALHRIARIKTLLDDPFHCTYANLRHQFQTLYESIEDDLSGRLFWYIPQAQAEHLLRGLKSRLTARQDVALKDSPELPNIENEWSEAELCYALERYTACVMHLMRLAELGLRTLTRRLVGETIGNRSVEFVDWKPMLDAVEPVIADKLKELDNQLRTKERERAVGFYSGVMSHLKYLKTIRDEAAHARGIYDQGQALSTLRRAKDFMTLLAEKHNRDLNKAP
jgi:hypothetical protein